MSDFKKGDKVLESEDRRRSFWSRVEVGGADECWEWTGYKNDKGYGRIQFFRGANMVAHRIALCLATGRRYEYDLFACHHCDNPGCCNPHHLFWATPKENTHDAMSKGRLVDPPRLDQRGENNNNARLYKADIRAIRRRYEPYVVTQSELADEYGVSVETIRAIVEGKRWAHV